MNQKNLKYIIWDGENEKEYTENSRINDCIVSHDLKKISVQKIRKSLLDKDVVPTIIFGCKSGESAHEDLFNGEYRGVFSYYYTSVLGIPNITFREAIKIINERINASGVTQTCEIICRADILDMEFNKEIFDGEIHSLLIFDMCRK